MQRTVRRRCSPFSPIRQPMAAQKVQRIDTHAASVFLAGDRALKVKRAVRFPFLDYSTLDKRKAACEAELAVNAPYAPEIYRGVVPITREADGRARHRRPGHAGRVGGRDAALRRDSARSITSPAKSTKHWPMRSAAPSPQPTPRRPSSTRQPWIAALGGYIDEHVEAFRQYPEIFPAAEIETLARLSRAAYQRIVPLLRERSRRGFVRRIHGDLHLGNIVLIDGKPVLFDAIEFSDIIASGDVFYDLAFLLMDLLERGLAFAGQYRAQPLPRADPPHRRPRRACDAAVLPCRCAPRSAPRSPRRGWSALQGAERAAIAALGARLFRLRAAGDRAAAPRNSSPSAAFPAPARRSSRGCWRRTSSRCPAP